VKADALSLPWFAAKLFCKRIKALFFSAPLVWIAALGLVILFGSQGLRPRMAPDGKGSLLVFAVLVILFLAGLRIYRPVPLRALERFANSRYTARAIVRLHYLNRALTNALVPALALGFSLASFVVFPPEFGPPALLCLTVFTAASSFVFFNLTSAAKKIALPAALGGSLVFLFFLYQGSLLLLAILTGLAAGAALWFFRFPRWESAEVQAGRTSRFFLPRLKSTLADYAGAGLLLYPPALFLSLYLFREYMGFVFAGGPEGVLKNYALVFLLLSSLPFMGIVDSVTAMNWKIIAMAGKGYGFYLKRSFLFFFVLSLPVWLPFFGVFLWYHFSGALLFFAVVVFNLFCMINLALVLGIPRLFKGLLCVACIIFTAVGYYAENPGAFFLLIPGALFFWRARGDIYDWGSYDYMR
jgi:hypothetical protein